VQKYYIRRLVIIKHMNTMKNILFKGVVQLLCIASILGCSRVGNAYMNSENSDNLVLNKSSSPEATLGKSDKENDKKSYRLLIAKISVLIASRRKYDRKRFLELFSRLEKLLRKRTINVNEALFENKKNKKFFKHSSQKALTTLDFLLYSFRHYPLNKKSLGFIFDKFHAINGFCEIFDLLKEYGLTYAGLNCWYGMGKNGSKASLLWNVFPNDRIPELNNTRTFIVEAFRAKTI